MLLGHQCPVMLDVSEDVVASLLAVIKSHLVGRDIGTAALDDERTAILQAWPRPRRPAMSSPPKWLPACDHLATAIAAAAVGPLRQIANALKPVLKGLCWGYGYPAHSRWPDLASRIAFAQIIGTRGLMNDEGIHLGLTLLAPHTHYPLHAHPAIELYLVLAGTAAWRVEHEPFVQRPPASLILHGSNIGHAMETDADPLLALYIWRGDLETAPVYVGEPVPL
jgi:hypothetical protein